ncbi:hypothetical protein TNCV_2479671 [Trichonephila clavipes]|nr:hypothetical protein TNCV_2479671 [Trichonephila clavipes]
MGRASQFERRRSHQSEKPLAGWYGTKDTSKSTFFINFKLLWAPNNNCGTLEKEKFQMAFLEKAKKQDLVLLAEELGQKGNRGKNPRQHAIQQLRWESELNELRLEIESIRSNVKRTSCAENRKKTSSNYRIRIGRAGEHMRETSPAVLMAEATIPVTTPIKEENGMDDLRVVYVKVKGEQEMVNAVMDTGA